MYSGDTSFNVSNCIPNMSNSKSTVPLPAGHRFREGDRIGFEINHIKHTCNLYYNGMLCGEDVFVKVPNIIIPAASNSNSKPALYSIHAVETFMDDTMYEDFYKNIGGKPQYDTVNKKLKVVK